MTAPRAIGVRTTYAAIPMAVRTWVEETLGSPVVSVAEQSGGFSPGCASRVVTADGSRAFVKAVGVELNPDTPTLFRREILTLSLLGADPLWARLLASHDADGWVALLLEDVEGVHPDLTDDDQMALMMAATDRLATAVAQRVPEPPTTPAAADGGLNDMRLVYGAWADSFDRLDEAPLVPGWVRAETGHFQDGVRRLAGQPADRLVHWDIRNDNLLLTPDGRIVFVDWGAAGRGSDWLDPMLARLERVHLPWFDESLASSPALVRAGDEAVTMLLVGVGTYLAWRAAVAVDVNLPTLAEFRRAESARFLAAAARRLGVAGGPGDLGGSEARC